jgi:hypothetical protein
VVRLLALVVLAASASTRADVPAEAVLADLPFLDTQERNRIYLDLAPAGSARPLRVLLDTGANVSLMTPGAAKAAGVRVRFLDRERYQVPESTTAEGEAVLPITVVSNRPALRFEVNGRGLEILLDTGAPVALMLSGELARATRVESAPDAASRCTG